MSTKRRTAVRSDRAPREIELKLAFDPRDRALLEQQLNGPGAKERLVSIYFDTADRRLADHGLTLRVRKVGEKRTQTLKARDGGRGAAADRGEWEWPIATDRPEIARLAGTPFTGILSPSAELVPLFRTEVDRMVHLLSLDSVTQIEAVLDDGMIIAGDRQEPLHELELELKRGRPEALYRVAARLHETVPLTIAIESKFGRGDALKSGHTAGASKVNRSSLARKMPPDQAFRDVVGDALGNVLANLAPTLRGDVEGLHQMRVALRRLRAELVLFKPILNVDRARDANDHLRRLGQVLGAARDWDVLTRETLPAITGQTWPFVLQQTSAIHRKAAWARVEEELRTPEFTAFVLSISADLETDEGGFVGEAEVARTIRKMAPGLLDRLARKVRKRGRHLDRLDRPALHALRKSMKKLRYGVAALESLFDERQVKRYLSGCKSLQKILGRINDASAAERLVASAVSPDRKDLADPLRSLAKWARRRQRRDRAKLDEAWSKFAAARPFWR